jgi:hypothetical protein
MAVETIKWISPHHQFQPLGCTEFNLQQVKSAAWKGHPCTIEGQFENELVLTMTATTAPDFTLGSIVTVEFTYEYRGDPANDIDRIGTETNPAMDGVVSAVDIAANANPPTATVSEDYTLVQADIDRGYVEFSADGAGTENPRLVVLTTEQVLLKVSA